LPEDGTQAVGHHRYHLEQVSTPAEPLSTNTETRQSHEHGRRLVPDHVGYGSSPDIMRTVALILVTIGVLLLLLALWQ
jgi:hypothetical protein